MALVVVTSTLGFGVLLAVCGSPGALVAVVAGDGFDGSLFVLVAVVEGGGIVCTLCVVDVPFLKRKKKNLLSPLLIILPMQWRFYSLWRRLR